MIKIPEEDFFKLQNHFMKSIFTAKMVQKNDHESSSAVGSFLKNLVGQTQLSSDKNTMGTLTKDKSVINNFINFDIILGSRKYVVTVD
jgi:hypothetical protein